jgi:hypothetical protein
VLSEAELADMEQAAWDSATFPWVRGYLCALMAEVRRLRTENDALRQQAAGKPLAWSRELPAVPGWYWWRDGSDDEAEVKEVCDVGYLACDHSAPTPGGYVQGLFKLGDVGGEWAGPIPVPAC